MSLGKEIVVLANIGLSIYSFVWMYGIPPQDSAYFFRNRPGLPCFRFVNGRKVLA